MEKVLQYSRANVRQDTGYFCGPASCQTIILAATGKLVSEAVLARELGTHTGGTDYIGQFPKVLQRHIPVAKYRHRDYTAYLNVGQKDQLWKDIILSINAGHGVVANFVAPPSNYPKAVYPSTISPAYRGGTVYHYVAVMGYSTATKSNPNGTRKVWVADSGFAPFGYWLDFEQFCTLIVPKGVAFSAALTKPENNITTPAEIAKQFDDDYFTLDWAKKFHFGNPRDVTKRCGICLHTTENDRTTTAQSVASWQISTESGSYHKIIDSVGTVLRCNTPSWRTWSTGNKGNDILDHIAFVARASWTRAQWLAETRMLAQGAITCAHTLKKQGWPAKHVSVAFLPGITTHDETRAWGGTDHTDPGPNFPWDVFIPMVEKELKKLTSPTAVVKEKTVNVVKRIKSLINPAKSFSMEEYVALIDASIWRQEQVIRAMATQAGVDADAVIAKAIKADKVGK